MGERHAPRALDTPTQRRVTLVFAATSGINGGLVGMTGPALQSLGEATGLGNEALGRIILINRLSKFMGSFAWTAYAKRLQEGRASFSSRLLIACCVAVISVCSLWIATIRSSALVLQVALGCSGAAYGISDSAMTLLTIWANRQPSQQRTHVALLNVGFTVGALITPAVVAAAFRTGSSCYLGFYVLSATAALLVPWLVLTPQSARPLPPLLASSPKTVPIDSAYGKPTSEESAWRSPHRHDDWHDGRGALLRDRK